nr:uncharacterized protein LOC127309369 [Lolium perenne]
MNRSCNAHQKEIRVEKRSPVMPPPPKKVGRQSAIGVPPGFPPLNSSIGKRLAAELSARGKKSRPVQESQGSRPGTAKRGQNPLVGFLPEAKFCPRFKRQPLWLAQNSEGVLSAHDRQFPVENHHVWEHMVC